MYLCIHQCIAVTHSQTDKFGFECINTAYCGEMEEQALALKEQPRQGTAQQSELFTLAEEAQCCVLYNLCVGCTLAPLMYSVSVTFPFTTLCSGRGLIMWLVQLTRGSSLHW